MVEVVGSIKMRRLESFLTNTHNPYKNIFLDRSGVVGFYVQTQIYIYRLGLIIQQYYVEGVLSWLRYINQVVTLLWLY
jgi:hypothetical protein